MIMELTWTQALFVTETGVLNLAMTSVKKYFNLKKTFLPSSALMTLWLRGPTSAWQKII